MTPPDDPTPAARHEIDRLFGQCILQFQAFELTMKAVLGAQRLSMPLTGPGTADRAAETRIRTMGGLVGEMIGSFLVAQGQEGPPEDGEDAPGVVIGQQMAFPAETFARIEADHRDLVALRNRLVHHFLEEHDLRSEDGCRAARQDLETALARVTRALKDLHGWAKEADHARRCLADLLTSPGFLDAFVRGGPGPDTAIAQGLQQAALELGQGDWASVESATRWMEERYPEEKPDGYRCRSWKQVIQESRLFELRAREVDGRRQTYYRPRFRLTAPT